MRRLVSGFGSGLAACLLLSFAGCSSGSGGGGGGQAPVLQSISVTPSAPSVAAGATAQLSATGTYSDGTSKSLTSTAAWSSSTAATATVSASGLVTAVAPGTTTISAKSGSITGTTVVTVPNPLTALSVSPTTVTIAATTATSFKAMGTFLDGTMMDVTSSASWTSSATAVASVSDTVPTKGLAKGLTAGTTTIKASYTNAGSATPITATGALTVTSATLISIAVTPASPTIPLGVLQQFTAEGTFFDGSVTTMQDITNTVTWSSSNSNVAPITVSGLATGSNLGSATITATSGAISGTASVTVNAANLVSITIQPGSPSMAQNTSLKLKAVGTFNDGGTRDLTTQVGWTSSDTTKATIGAATGVAKGVAAGQTTITATLSGSSVPPGTATLNVTNATVTAITVAPANKTIAPGTKQVFNATGSFSDGSTQIITSDVTWASDNTAVATITAAGSAKGVAAGSAHISATLASVTGSTLLTVTGATLSSIAVTPTSTVLAPASILVYQAVGTYSDGSTQNISNSVAWTSGDTSVVTINPGSGQATGQSAGATTIKAALGSISGTSNIVVEASALQTIAVVPATDTIPEQVELQYVANATFADGSTQNLTNSVTWTSSAPGVATISDSSGSQGLAVGVSPGTSNITAAFNGVVGAAKLTVTNATIVTVTVAPSSANIALGSSQQFTATGNFSDGSTQDLTNQVTWTSSTVGTAVINSTGLANSAGTGTTTIKATFTTTMATATGMATLTVH